VGAASVGGKPRRAGKLCKPGRIFAQFFARSSSPTRGSFRPANPRLVPHARPERVAPCGIFRSVTNTIYNPASVMRPSVRRAAGNWLKAMNINAAGDRDARKDQIEKTRMDDQVGAPTGRPAARCAASARSKGLDRASGGHPDGEQPFATWHARRPLRGCPRA